MGSGVMRMLQQEPVEAWIEVSGVIKSFDAVSGSYVVTMKGADVGSVWSINERRHAAGASVTVLMRGGVAVGLVP